MENGLTVMMFNRLVVIIACILLPDCIKFGGAWLQVSRMTMASARTKTRWDFGRFLKTARFYDALTPKLPFVSRISSSREKLRPKDIIWNRFSEASANLSQPSGPGARGNRGIDWGPLDDVVMGGASKTDLEPGQTFNGTWTGFTTTANNGGFSGIRTKLFKRPFDATTCEGIALKLQGDGQRYKLILRG